MEKLLLGKIVLFLGDSITEGACATAHEKKYVNVFGEISGATVYNYGKSGTRIARQIHHSENAGSDGHFVTRIDDMPPKADYVFVLGGTNDFGHGDAPFGTLNDTTDDTFCGAVYDLITRLKNKYPTSKIIMVTPLRRLSENATINEIGLPCKPLSEYAKAIKDVATKLGVTTLDAFHEFDLRPDPDQTKDRFFVDGLHPNDLGHQRIAEYFYRFIS